MCKRSFSAFAAQPKKRTAVANSEAHVSETVQQHGNELTIREMIAAGGDLEQIKSSVCGLTNDLHPIFDEKNICRRAGNCDGQIEGSLEPTWGHPRENLVLRSALQVATRIITHEDTLPFWAGLIDCARPKVTDGPRPFRVRARKRLDADKANSVLEYLTGVARNIRFHFKSFESLDEDELSSVKCNGFCTLFDVGENDPDFDPSWTELYNYGWRDGKLVVQADVFSQIFLNVDAIDACDMSDDDWLDRKVSDIRSSILGFANTIGHEFAHAMADITQNGNRAPHLNDEAVVETGFSWENFVFGGRLDFDDGGGVHCAPWPSYRTWEQYASDSNTLQLCALGRGALPLERVCQVEKQAWESFFDQRFWDQRDSPRGAFKKLWLRGSRMGYDVRHYYVRERLSAPTKGKRTCPCEELRQRRRINAIQKKGDDAMKHRPDRWDRVVDKSEESKDVFHESDSKLILDEFWVACTKHIDQDVFL